MDGIPRLNEVFSISVPFCAMFNPNSTGLRTVDGFR